MSTLLVQQYLNELADLKRVSGDRRESVVREAFKSLLKGWGRARDLVFVPEYEYTTPAKDCRYVDGALLHELRVPFGFWEAKDEKDNLDAEIEYKFRRGYPRCATGCPTFWQRQDNQTRIRPRVPVVVLPGVAVHRLAPGWAHHAAQRRGQQESR